MVIGCPMSSALGADNESGSVETTAVKLKRRSGKPVNSGFATCINR